MKLISMSTEPTMLAERLEARTVIGVSSYVVKFSCNAGDVEITLRGDLAGRVKRAVDGVLPYSAEGQVAAALAILGDLAREFSAGR